MPRSASAHALTNCELRFLSRAARERLAQQCPEIHQYLVKLLAARLRQADEIIASLAFLPVKARVAQALLALAENLGEETDSGRILIPRMINQASEWERKNLVNKSSGSYRSMIRRSSKGEIDTQWMSNRITKRQIPSAEQTSVPTIWRTPTIRPLPLALLQNWRQTRWR